MEEDEWHFHQPFDFIHSRMMVGSFKDWPKFMSTAYKWLRPGGWLECQDVDSLDCDDDTFSMNPPSCALARWWSLVCEAFDKIDRSVLAAPNHQKCMIDARFVDTRDEIYKWPINTWPKDEKMKLIGLWSRENTLEALEALALAPLTRILGWSKEEVMVLVAQARKDVINPEIHAYWNMWVLIWLSFMIFFLTRVTQLKSSLSMTVSWLTLIFPVALSTVGDRPHRLNKIIPHYSPLPCQVSHIAVQAFSEPVRKPRLYKNRFRGSEPIDENVLMIFKASTEHDNFKAAIQESNDLFYRR